MMWVLLAFFSAVALWWVALWLVPAQRRMMRFVYTTEMMPDALNGGFPGDDVAGAFGGDPAEWPRVTVIVPGRNEGHLLEKTLGSLCAMEYPTFRVVFVDDQSTDSTAAVCAALRTRHRHLTVIYNKEGPRDGWVGKTWAVHQAEKHMHDGGYLLFTDSDLEFHPQCLKQAMRLALHRRTDITSMLPRIRAETLGELLGLLSAMVIVNSRLNLYMCNDPKMPQALVAGGFLLVKQAVYHELGGHAAVRGQVVEDIAFGTRAKAARKRVFTAMTHDLYRARMYEGWRDTFRGLKKNAYAGANYSLPFAGVIAAFLFFVGALVPAYAAVGVAWWVMRPSVMTAVLAGVGVLALAAELATGWRTARFLGMRPWVAVTLPAGFLLYLAVFVGSVVDYYRGGNVWAGRQMKATKTLADAAK